VSKRHCSGIACQSGYSHSGLKKIVHLEPVNRELLQQLKPEEVEVDVVRAKVERLRREKTGVAESELDEMWSL